MNVTVGILSSVCVAGKRMVSVVGTCTATGTIQIRYGFGCGATETATGSITIEAPMLEDITGQSNQNPSEYVSVGSPILPIPRRKRRWCSSLRHTERKHGCIECGD